MMELEGRGVAAVEHHVVRLEVVGGAGESSCIKASCQIPVGFEAVYLEGAKVPPIIDIQQRAYWVEEGGAPAVEGPGVEGGQLGGPHRLVCAGDNLLAVSTWA